jgi:hypothetical protein
MKPQNILDNQKDMLLNQNVLIGIKYRHNLKKIYIPPTVATNKGLDFYK